MEITWTKINKLSLILLVSFFLPINLISQDVRKHILGNSLSVSFINYSKNYIGIDRYYKTPYTWDFLPEIKFTFPHKGFNIRSIIGFNYYHNEISTTSFYVADYRKSITGNYVQTALSVGIEKTLVKKFLIPYLTADFGFSPAFYSGTYSYSYMGAGETNDFDSFGGYLFFKSGLGLELNTSYRLKFYFETAFYIDKLVYKHNDDYSLLPKSRFRLEPISQLGIKYFIKLKGEN